MNVQIFPDTPVLVPAFLAALPNHQSSLKLLTLCKPDNAACAAHPLAELYSTLTRLPAPHRATPEQALHCVETVADRFQPISPDGQTYPDAIRLAAPNGISGGTIYDCLIARCAIQCGAEQIFTWNLRHFEQFGPEVISRLTSPET